MSELWRSRWAAIGAVLAITLGAGGIGFIGASNGAQPVSVSISPCRLFDTRAATQVGIRGTALGAGETMAVAAAGASGDCNLPNTVSSLLINVTVVGGTAGSYLTVYPTGTSRPTASNLNWSAGQGATPNLVSAAVGANGHISIFNLAGTVNVLGDVTGYTVGHAPNQLSNSQIGQMRWDQDPTTPGVFGVGDGPISLAFDGESIWVANAWAGTVSKIDPATNTVSGTVTVGSYPDAVAFDGASIWVANESSDTLSKINPLTMAVVATVTVGDAPHALVFDGSYIWVANRIGTSVMKVNIHTNAVVATVGVFLDPEALAFDGSQIWVASRMSNLVQRINAATNEFTLPTITVNSPQALSFDGANIWVAMNGGFNTVAKINIANNSVIATIAVGSNPGGVVFDGTNIWVTNNGGSSVTKIDPTTNTVLATISVPGGPWGIAADGSNIWIGKFSTDEVAKLRQ